MQMQKLLLCILVAASITDSCRGLPSIISSWHIPWWHGRSLQQRASRAAAADGRGVPMCMWNEQKEFCSPSQLVFLAVEAPPSTVLHRAVTAAYDRNLVCSGHPDEATCQKDRSNRCFWWNRSCVGADAYELVNWFGAGSVVNGDAAILDFTCPGTVANQYKLCRSATDAGPEGICNKLPGCQWMPLMKECMPQAFDAKPLADLQAINRGFNTVDATTWGSCEGACYVKQAIACQQSYNSSAECKRKAYCVWEFDGFDGREVCIHRDTMSRGLDAYSKEFAAVKDKCVKLKSMTACERPRVSPKQVGKYRRARRPSDPAVVSEAGAKCVT